MTDGQFFVQTDGWRDFSQTHADIEASIRDAIAAIANGTGVPFTDLIDALHARQGTFQTTANGGKTLAELLLKAAQAHDQGDQQASGNLGSTDALERRDEARPGETAAEKAPAQADQECPASPRDL